MNPAAESDSAALLPELGTPEGLSEWTDATDDVRVQLPEGGSLPDPRRCTFIGTDLRQATLDGASFKMCDFTGANLRGASLRGTHSAGCDLQKADLRDADLTDAHLTFVNTGQDTVGCTNLIGAKLLGATTQHLTVERVIGLSDRD